jgi:hypothetical protein
MVAALLLLFVLPFDTLAARKDCAAEIDTGARIKCKMENLNDSFDSFVSTVVSDDTGIFSEAQKKQLQDLKAQVHEEAARTPPEDFKQMGKKHDVECRPQEILGDVRAEDDLNGNKECDLDEICIGDEDGICDDDEYRAGGCAEVLGDGIGDDDGICEAKGHYREVCVEICDTDVIMADETNVDRDRANDVEQSLEDVMSVVDVANVSVADLIAERRIMAESPCGPEDLTACEYLDCLMQNDRKHLSMLIELAVGGATEAKLFADFCRDGAKWDKLANYSALCAIPGIVQSGLQIVATVFEVADDCETSERIDAAAACMVESASQGQAVLANLRTVIDLLQTPPGHRPGYPDSHPQKP